MQFSIVLSALVLGFTATAAPTAANPSWTINSFTRTCDSADTSCAYSFGINTNDGSPVTSCAYTATGSPASRASYNGVTCGAFVVSSNWSGQFGPGNGFQTLALVQNGQKIAYPAYEDKALANGKAVSPDRSFQSYNL